MEERSRRLPLAVMNSAVSGKDSVKPIIKEVIVVEGKDDIAAVKAACDAQTIATGGLGISREIIEQIMAASKNAGVIILTDPDSAGERIRSIIGERVPGCKHAFLYQNRDKGRKNQRSATGVEYANPREIIDALKNAKATTLSGRADNFNMTDLIGLGLAGTDRAAEKRHKIAKKLSIGQCNCKQFLRRLNDYGVSRDALLSARGELGE